MVSTKQPDENNYRAFQLLPMTISYLKKWNVLTQLQMRKSKDILKYYHGIKKI